MRILIAAVIAVTTAASPRGASQNPPVAEGPTSRSIWDGVYTEEQARRGKDLYLTHCLSCHGESLQGGGQVHALVGPEFAANWNGLSMGDMLERTRISMPMDKPGTLSRQQIADVLSFVLSANKAPAGTVELPRQTELLSAIKFLARKPSADPPPAPR
jgi:quinoprotein glucose dehydrogenase